VIQRNKAARDGGSLRGPEIEGLGDRDWLWLAQALALDWRWHWCWRALARAHTHTYACVTACAQCAQPCATMGQTGVVALK